MKAGSTGTDLISKVLPGPAMARVKTERKIWMMNGIGRHLILKIQPMVEAASCKLQASSLTTDPGPCRINLERNNMKFEKPKKKTIDWYGKKVSVPFDCQIYPEKEVEIANRFSGQKTTMPGYAAAVYDTIIGAEQFEDWDTVRAGLDWFRKNFAAQYMVVLD